MAGLKREKADSVAIADHKLATDLVKASKLHVFGEEYITRLIKLVTDAIKGERVAGSLRPKDTLIKLASHTCDIDLLQNTIALLDKKVEENREEGTSEDDIDVIINSALSMVATVLVQGFDKVEENKLERDESGNVIGIIQSEQGRYPECDKALRSGETLGGKRKTRKKSHKKRKTSRRTKK